MTWARAKNTKEKLLTPRPCPHCGQPMSKEFLEQRHALRGKRISEALQKTLLEGGRIGRKPLSEDRILELRRQGYSFNTIRSLTGHTMPPIRRICSAAGLSKVKLACDNTEMGRSSSTDGNRPWLHLKKVRKSK